MAAGEGRRLRPVTDRWAKPVLPIDGRPVIATLLNEIRAAGVERAVVVTGHLAEQVEALVGDGGGFGLDVRYVRQPEPHGSVDVVRRALAAGATTPLLVTAADTSYTAGDVARFAIRAAEHDGALAVRRGYEPSQAKPGVRMEGGFVRRVYDLEPGIELTSAPLWLLGEALLPFLDDVPGPPYELKDAAQAAIDSGIAVAGIEIGPTRDLTDPLDLVRQNFTYLGSL
jgi:CTP:molybdopterin cytidylyltransferase MocA